MTQTLENQSLPGFQRGRSRLGELLAADALVAAGSAALVTPAVMIFDRYALSSLNLRGDY